ncbi:HD domain-containing protein [Protomyces lactucae-debilis]|uniref:5'-deoxynucleotidase n=1 Tax=Protomyces lactucae-debilis TaxID=2754530 RepID=A0A1Y2FK97_PROLT|nr:HD domain-containing protein [Protomyces lactucae-debilis]ORY83646.1 HD domain-containing protein [Protomyces lactucae-debilis]
MLMQNTSTVLPFVHLLEKLKTTKRAGWLNESLCNTESIADHMYRMAMLTLLCNDPALDKTRMMALALVHDLAEAIVGDITPRDNVPKLEKQRLEQAAMEHICTVTLPVGHAGARRDIMSLFEEYEERASPEARYVKDLDTFELLVQVTEYEVREGFRKNLGHFLDGKETISHPQVRAWRDEALKERDAHWHKFKMGEAAQESNDTVRAVKQALEAEADQVATS